MKYFSFAVAALTACCLLASCGTRKGYRADDPYLYKRGHWNFSKGGLVDDIPQFLLQMCESMFDYGAQPVDPPSEYETVTAYETGLGTDAASSAVAAEAAAAAEAGDAAISEGAPAAVGRAIAAEGAAEAADARKAAAQPEMDWK